MFSKARSRLYANVFDPLNTELLRLVDEALPGQPLWQGLRVPGRRCLQGSLDLAQRGGQAVREATLIGLFRPGIELFASLILHSPWLVSGRCCSSA
ncbi:MAG: hypothetical protein IPP03_22700 [Dechloromonas sp.]|nr:hypothetical protein [Candidatus Dechloromonas phosphoritropha]